MNFLRKKIDRFFESRNVFKIRYLLNKIFGEKDLGNLGLDFSDKPTRQTIVQEIINLKNYQSYLEIGCYKNDLFDNVKCNIKVGVDPISGGTVRKTSDDYYKTNKEKFDIIFIDGLHHYEQVIKDINNSLNVLNENGVILLPVLPEYGGYHCPSSQYVGPQLSVTLAPAPTFNPFVT